MTPIVSADRAGAVLRVDLAAIVANWRLLRRRVDPAACAAVVKADAYGLGADEVAPALLTAGCRQFFVATLDEAIALRRCLEVAHSPRDACEIFVLNGAPADAAPEVQQARLTPVVNALADIDAWSAVARSRGTRVPAALHVDTGMARLGLPPEELAQLRDDPSRLDGLDLRCIMTHLACTDTPQHPMNARQRNAFRAALAILRKAPVSLANSSGIFLGAHYWGDLVRPGAALYGVSPVPAPNPMRGVVRLDAKILQVRQIDSGSTVGYGATHRAVGRQSIATIAVGYADGLMRSLGNRGSGYIGAQRVPIVGRISMDLTTFDVSDVPESLARPGACIELIGPHHPIDAIAAEAGTIGYEILTALGARFARIYAPAGA